MSTKPKPAPPREIQVNDRVLTITGRPAVVTRTDDRLHEATLRRLDDGEAVSFRQKHLRREK